MSAPSLRGALPASFDLSGRVALISGAGSSDGIGAATAQTLAAFGAHVMLTSLGMRCVERAEHLRHLGWSALAQPADLMDAAAATALISHTVHAFGGLDIVVANAGMTADGTDTTAEQGTLTEINPDAWRRALDRNLATAVHLIRPALSHLRRCGRGRIIVVASVTGPVMAMRGEVAYATAKAGMAGLVRALAVDEGPRHITANAIAPGWIATGSQQPAEAAEGLRTPLGRSGDPQEVAAAIGWLAGPGGGYTTGQVIVVDGGNSIAEQRT